MIAATSLLFGVMAMVRVTTAAVRTGGGWRWLLTAIWSALGLALAAAAMIGATWALRAAREVYHPWYARPDRLFLLLLAVGTTAAWAMSRAGAVAAAPRARDEAPGRHVEPHAAGVGGDGGGGTVGRARRGISVDAAVAHRRHPAAADAAVESEPALRITSTVVLAVTATLWLRDYGGAPAFHGCRLRPAAARDAGVQSTRA